jgi:hypothetical protein
MLSRYQKSLVVHEQGAVYCRVMLRVDEKRRLDVGHPTRQLGRRWRHGLIVA